MDERLGTAQEAAIGFAKQLRKEDQGGHRLRQPGPRPPAVHQRRRGAREGDPEHRRQRLDLALQRALHRAEGAEAGQGELRRGHPPAGDRPAVRRRRHVEPDRVRRGARSRQAVGDGDLRDRPAAERERSRGVQGSGVRAEAARARNRRPGLLRPTAAELAKIYQQIWDELASQYASPTRRGTRSATARGGGSSCACRAGLTARTRQGYYGPDARAGRSSCTWCPSSSTRPPPRPTSRISPGAIRAPAAWRRRSSAAPCSPTRSSSACRRWKRATRRWSARPPRSRRSSGCSASPTCTSS